MISESLATSYRNIESLEKVLKVSTVSPGSLESHSRKCISDISNSLQISLIFYVNDTIWIKAFKMLVKY